MPRSPLIRLRLAALLCLFLGAAACAQDWANLAKYHAMNRDVPPASVVFMGDSITEFWAETRPAFFAGRPYVDRGISGQTTPQMLLRFRPDVVDLKPSVVVLLAGINDIAGNTGPTTLSAIEDNIASMVDLARTNGIRVVLCSVLPAKEIFWHRAVDPVPQVQALNQWIAGYAAVHHLPYVDYYSAMVDGAHGLKASLTEDGVHPNAAGYAVMEPLVEDGIRRALR